MAELSRVGIAKNGVNEVDDYRFRTLDDVFKALSPLLAKHRLCVLPKVLSKTLDRAHATSVTQALVHVQFDLVCARDGSQHSIEALGEATDDVDKATAKAMSAAFKHAMIQIFCIPVGGRGDADRATPAHALDPATEPVQGWEQWTSDIIELIEGCETTEAVLRVHDTYRPSLRALSHGQPTLFAKIGDASAAKRAALAKGGGPGRAADSPASARWLMLPDRLRRNSRRQEQGRRHAAHRAWVRGHHCVVEGCRSREIECAHVRMRTDGGIALKPSDQWTVSLCRTHHAEQHRLGEHQFEQLYGIDLKTLAQRFARRSPHIDVP